MWRGGDFHRPAGMGARGATLLGVADEIGDLPEGGVQFGAQALVVNAFRQGLAHAVHPGVARGRVDGERLVAPTQHGVAALAAVVLGAAHPFAQVLDQHGLGVAQVGRMHGADGGGLGPAVHGAVEGVNQTDHGRPAAHARPVRVGGRGRSDGEGGRVHGPGDCKPRTTQAEWPHPARAAGPRGGLKPRCFPGRTPAPGALPARARRHAGSASQARQAHVANLSLSDFEHSPSRRLARRQGQVSP